jgi:hypothetical protein
MKRHKRLQRVLVAFLSKVHQMKSVHSPVIESVLMCPHCGTAKRETMAQDACQFFYECTHCKALLRPKSGDCCVFCSFGSMKCPPIQQQRPCC